MHNIRLELSTNINSQRGELQCSSIRLSNCWCQVYWPEVIFWIWPVIGHPAILILEPSRLQFLSRQQVFDHFENFQRFERLYSASDLHWSCDQTPSEPWGLKRWSWLLSLSSVLSPTVQGWAQLLRKYHLFKHVTHLHSIVLVLDDENYLKLASCTIIWR